MTRLTVLIAVILCFGLAACGRKASPQAPVDAIYPVVYPKVQNSDDHWVAPKDALDSNSAVKSTSP